MGKIAVLKKIAQSRGAPGSTGWWADRDRRLQALAAERAYKLATDPFGDANRARAELKAQKKLEREGRKLAQKQREQVTLQKKQARKELKERNQEALRSGEDGVAVEYVLLGLYYWFELFWNPKGLLHQGYRIPDPYKH